MIGLTEGRDIHYVDAAGVHYAGNEVVDASKRLVNVFIFPRRKGEEGGVIENVPFKSSTAAEPSSRPGTWHWIERVEA